MTEHAKRKWNIPERVQRDGGLRWSILNNGGMYYSSPITDILHNPELRKKSRVLLSGFGLLKLVSSDFYNKHKRYGYR